MIMRDHTINGKIRASMRDRCYAMSLKVNCDGNILNNGSCECPRGSWICSHIDATAIYANRLGLSKTDLPNSWIARPKTAAKQDGKTRKLLLLERAAENSKQSSDDDQSIRACSNSLMYWRNLFGI